MPGGPSNPRADQQPHRPAPEIGEAKREMPHGVYRVAPDGSIARVIEETQVEDPNGLCFSPDFSRLYVASTGKGPGDTGAGGKGEIFVFDLSPEGAISNGRLFTDCVVEG